MGKRQDNAATTTGRAAARRGARLTVVSTSWTRTDDGMESRAAARAMVAVLSGLPQPALNPPAALRAGHDKDAEQVQLEEPVSYTELDERFLFNGSIPSAGGTERTERLNAFRQGTRKRPAQAVRAQSSARGGKRRGTGMNRRRPGKGGRQPRVTAHNETTATAELLAELGEPQEAASLKGAKLMWWRHEGGKGMSLARLSGQEIHEGETVMGQVHANRRLFRDLALQPLYTVVTLYNSGGRRYEERPDFFFLEQCLREGEIDWIAARDLDRLIRDDLARAKLFDVLRRTKTDLYLARLGRRVDWMQDKILLQTLGTIGEHERDMTRERTQSAIISRYIAEGRGRPGSARFGFYRDKLTKDLRVDPDQWPLLKLIHLRYDELGGRRGSLRKIQEELEDQGCPFSVSYLSTLLRDPIYVTGEYTTRVGDRLVSCKPVALDDPIPADVYQRNQERLAQNRGPHKTTPPGFFCLNAIPVIHAACAEKTVRYKGTDGKEHETQPLLRGRRYTGRDRPLAYTHKPRVPACCKGYSLSADILEAAVTKQLIRLADNRHLREEWATSAPVAVAKPKALISAEQRREIEQQIRGLEARKAALEEELVQRIIRDEPATNEDHKRLVGPVEEKIHQLRRRLEVADQLPRRVAEPATDPAVAEMASAAGIDPAVEPDLMQALRVVLTEERPEDEDHLRRRAAVIQAALSAIVIHDVEGGVAIELQGPLVPPDAEMTDAIGPLHSAAPILKAHLADSDSARAVEQAHPCSMVCAGADTDAGYLVPPGAPVIPCEEIPDLYFSPGRPLTPDDRTDRPQHAHRRPRAPRGLPRPNQRGLGCEDWVPAWISPRLPVAELDAGMPVTFEACLLAIARVARSLDDAMTMKLTDYEEAFRRDPSLPHPRGVLLKRGRERGMNWAAIRELAFARDPALADPHRGEPLLHLAKRLGHPYSTLTGAAKRGALRSYRQFGTFFSREEWIEKYFSERRIGRPPKP